MRDGKKRARPEPGSTIHPRNKYSENPPDFALLASLFKPYLFFSGGRLDRLQRDPRAHSWIPDGQLCPTVPNRSNYIKWINHLLSSEIIQSFGGEERRQVKGFDIGTGAFILSLVHPFLVASDFTHVAWAEKNVKSNPHISDLIEIRDSKSLPLSSSDSHVPEVENRDRLIILNMTTRAI